MKILMIAPDAFPVSSSTGGSVEICMYQIGKRIADKEHVTILSRKAKGLPSKEKKGNLTMIRLPKGSQYLREVIREAKHGDWDIIQVDNRPLYIPVLRKHFPSSKIILNLHSLTFMSKISRSKQELVVKKSTAILCNSRFIRNQYIKKFPSYSSKFHAIYLGTDISRFRPPSEKEKKTERAKYRLNSAYHILNVGRIIPGKGIHILVKAAGILRKKYPHFRLLIVGPLKSAVYRKKLIQEARKRKVNMRILGPKSPASIHRSYWLGDVFVCPTQMPEAFGLVNVEAMASGLPVIGSSRGGMREILRDSRGILVNNYKSVKAFSNAILQLIKNPEKARMLANKGRRYVLKKFSWNGVASHYRSFYKKIRKSK